MNVTSKISLDLLQPNVGTMVNAIQGDGPARCVRVTLLAGGTAWDPPEDVEAAIAYRQPDGTKGLYNQLADGTAAISTEGNVATIILAPQMLSVSGTVSASIVFTNPQLDQLTTFPFNVSVARNAFAGAQKTEDYIRLQWLEDKLAELRDSGIFNGPAGPQGAQGIQGPAGSTGKDGKSAYQYAVDGGYSGTESEFARKLASGAMIVEITDNNGTLSANKTYDVSGDSGCCLIGNSGVCRLQWCKLCIVRRWRPDGFWSKHDI